MMKYCMNCGKQLPDDAKFCMGCGTPAREESPKKRVEQAGTIYKCPNCGEVLESMTAICPACGYEIRNGKAVNSVQSFSDKLAAIEAEEMPETDNDSIMKKVFGRDLRETPKRLEEARWAFEKQKLAKKINLISNFPVPNAKEDLIEFTMLVARCTYCTRNRLNHRYNTSCDLADWRGFLTESYPELSNNESKLYERMHELNADFLNDERRNLDIPLSQPILVIGDLGLWHGRVKCRICSA